MNTSHSHFKSSMTQEEALLIQAGDIVYNYDNPWLVLRTERERPEDERAYQFKYKGPWFLVRLGKTGNHGHEHWGSYSWYNIKPCCGE